MASPAIEIPHLLEMPPACFECGAQGQRVGGQEFEISERGMHFSSPREFTIGTQLDVLLRHMHPRLGLCHIHLEGIVVWCEPRVGQRCQTTLLFLELPDEIRPALREFSHRAPARD